MYYNYLCVSLIIFYFSTSRVPSREQGVLMPLRKPKRELKTKDVRTAALLAGSHVQWLQSA